MNNIYKGGDEVKKKEVRAYIGPTIAKYGLTTGNIYQYGYPTNISELINKYPLVTELFIAINKEYALKKKAVKTKGTKEFAIYNAVIMAIGGK